MPRLGRRPGRVAVDPGGGEATEVLASLGHCR
jgi:hypothetical protein